MRNKVIWSEGLFLQAQHFQQQDSYFEYLIATKTNGRRDNDYGISALQIDQELLALGKFGLTLAQGQFQDGTPFDAPSIDALPTPLTATDNITETTVYLALPLKKNGTAEISLNDQSDQTRYFSQRSTTLDTIKDNQQQTELQLAKLDLRLMLETDDRSQYTCIAIAIIKEMRSNGSIVLQQPFLQPVLNTNASHALSQFVIEVHSLLEHRADMIARRLADNQQSTSGEVADFMLLQLVNRYEPLFSHMIERSDCHPETLYLHATQLLSEISTYTNDSRRPTKINRYQHDQPNNLFPPLMQALRQALSMVLTQNAVAIALESKEYGVWMGEILDHELLSSANFVLAVYADNGNEAIRSQFAHQVKIASVEQIKQLVSRALPGIGLQPLAVAPRQIPYHANFSYFILDKQHQYWQQLAQSGGIAFHIGGHFPGLKLELWAIKG